LAETVKLRVHENSAARGIELSAALKSLFAKHALVGDVRSQGLMGALELVSDRSKKTPASKEVMSRVHEAAYDAGVMVRVAGHQIILSPPLVISAADVAKMAEALDAGLTAASS